MRISMKLIPINEHLQPLQLQRIIPGDKGDSGAPGGRGKAGLAGKSIKGDKGLQGPAGKTFKLSPRDIKMVITKMKIEYPEIFQQIPEIELPIVLRDQRWRKNHDGEIVALRNIYTDGSSSPWTELVTKAEIRKIINNSIAPPRADTGFPLNLITKAFKLKKNEVYTVNQLVIVDGFPSFRMADGAALIIP